MGNQPQKPHHLFVIIQRFAAAHQHDVMHPLLPGKRAVGALHLPQHFCRRQIAHAAVQRAGAEAAAHPAAHLRGQAQRAAVMIPHQHAFHAIAIPEGIEKFPGAVQLGNPFLPNLNGLIHPHRLQLFPKGQGQVGHFIKARALMQPGEKLPGPEGLFAHLGKRRLQFVGVHSHPFLHVISPCAAAQ